MQSVRITQQPRQAALLGILDDGRRLREIAVGRVRVTGRRAAETNAGDSWTRVRLRANRTAWTRSWRGAGARPVSSQRWHQSTRPTARATASAASQGFESQSAPPSSMTILGPPPCEQHPSSSIRDRFAGCFTTTFVVGPTPASLRASAEAKRRVRATSVTSVRGRIRTFDLNTCSSIYGRASIPFSSQPCHVVVLF
jgi:hypothetical protein